MNASKNISLVLTVIGDDRPGLVEQLATAISKHGGNWLESSMAHLSGKFAGIVCVTVGENDVEALKKEFAALAGLRITAEVAESADATPAKPSGRRLKLSLVGHDRIGIVREVSQVLARHAVPSFARAVTEASRRRCGRSARPAKRAGRSQRCRRSAAVGTNGCIRSRMPACSGVRSRL